MVYYIIFIILFCWSKSRFHSVNGQFLPTTVPQPVSWCHTCFFVSLIESNLLSWCNQRFLINLSIPFINESPTSPINAHYSSQRRERRDLRVLQKVLTTRVNGVVDNEPQTMIMNCGLFKYASEERCVAHFSEDCSDCDECVKRFRKEVLCRQILSRCRLRTVSLQHVKTFSTPPKVAWINNQFVS